MSDEAVEFELTVQRAYIDGDAETVMRLFTENGFITDPRRFSPERLMAQIDDSTWWWSRDETVTLDPSIATKIAIEMSDPRSSHFNEMRHETLPSEHLFARRVEMLTMAVLSQLRARGNFHRIALEWITGAPPATALGEQEAVFYARAAA
jgi:hypothetical protein